MVTGDVARTHSLKVKRTTVQDTALAHFSPVSKELSDARRRLGEIDILFATDCISEGQNLQDCDCLVNYDIHWNPVRIIQRLRRIDRLGSTNTTIQLVNFWPDIELDEYIQLEGRVKGRMALLDASATGEENVLEGKRNDEMNDLKYRRQQLQALQEEVLNLEDMSGGISITGLRIRRFPRGAEALRPESSGLAGELTMWALRRHAHSAGACRRRGTRHRLLPEAERRESRPQGHESDVSLLCYIRHRERQRDVSAHAAQGGARHHEGNL